MTAILEPVECPELNWEEPGSKHDTWVDVKVNLDVNNKHTEEMRQLIEEFSDFFRRTRSNNLEEHEIQLNTDNAIRMKPYPLPFSRVGYIERRYRRAISAGMDVDDDDDDDNPALDRFIQKERVFL